MTRLLRLTLLLALVATAVVLLWFRAVGGTHGIGRFTSTAPLALAAMLMLTGLCVLVRFLRWQFMMRHAGSRLTERPSLRIYLASLVGTATPAYVGEAIRGAFIRREFGVPLTVSLFVLVVERLMDVAAISFLGVVTADSWPLRGVMAFILALGVVGLLMAPRAGAALGLSPTVLRIVRRPDIVRDALVLSVVAWGLIAFDYTLGGYSLGLHVAPLESVRVFTSSVLLGGVTLMPAGIGSAGAFAIVQLDRTGISLANAFTIVSLVRIFTVGVTLLVGSVCLFAILRHRGVETAGDAAAHFDDIATEYGDQFQPHVWQHLLERKVGLLASALPPPGSGRGLDLGCGLGSQCLALAARGYNVFGMDVARRLAAQARKAGASVTAGSALALPFQDRCLDFVYAVGVLHHLPDRQAQRLAYAEIGRVLKPGGVFIVHETNTRNPLFRLYMGYVFPLLKKIDEGTEWWIEPDRWKGIPGLTLVRTDHFTFMPDFVPSWLMKPALAIDRWLERSWMRPYSVHYMAVLRCDPTWSPTSVEVRFADDQGSLAPARWASAGQPKI